MPSFQQAFKIRNMKLENKVDKIITNIGALAQCR